MFDYHCNWCGYDFFMEEGYDAESDDIVCPRCHCKRDNKDYFIKENMVNSEV